MKDYFDINYPNSRSILLPNGFDERDLDVLKQKDFSCLNTFFDKTKLSFLYTGTLSFYDKDRNLDALFNTLRLVKDMSDIEIVLVGDFRKIDFNENQDLVDEGIIKIHPKVTRDEALYLQSKADVLILVTGNKRKSVATGKLFEYLFSGKPILAFAKENYAAEIVQASNTGICFSNEDIEPLVSFINNILIEHKSGGISYNPNGDYIRTFERKNQVSSLVEQLEKMLESESH